MGYDGAMNDVHAVPLILNSALASDLDLIGDRWVLLILRDLFMGRTRFESLRKHTGASKATLSRRLEALINANVVKRVESKPGTKRFDYMLTEKGMGLFGASMLAWQWESQWFDCSEGDLPRSLFHRSCGNPLVPVTVCTHCRAPLKAGEVEWPQVESAIDMQMAVIRSSNNQRRVRASAVKPADLRLAHVSDLIGDRWTLLLLIAAFLGVKRNDGFVQQLKIASNILSQRLSMLVSAGIFEKQAYQHNPPRFEYLLTTKAKTLFPLIMVLRQWAMSQHPNSEPLCHTGCGKPLSFDVVCQSCEHPIKPSDVATEQV